LRSVRQAKPAVGQGPPTTVVEAPRFRLVSPGTATVLGVLVLVLAVATLTLMGLDHQLTNGVWAGVAIVLAYAGVGIVVARRQPGNPIGWLMLIFTVLYLLGSGAVITRCSAIPSVTGGCRWVR